MDDRARAELAALARRHGRELASLAYLILQNRHAAERAAAQGLADVLRGSPAGTDETPTDDSLLRDRLVGATLRRALDAHHDTREVDIAGGNSARGTLTAMSPLQRALVAGHLAGLGTERLAAEMGLPLRRVMAAMAAAERLAGGAEPLGQRLMQDQAGLPFSVAPEAVEAAMVVPPTVRRAARWPLVAALAAVAVLVAAVFAGGTPARPTGGEPIALPSLGRPLEQAGEPGRAFDERLTLADCDIQPASSEVAFRGWLTLGDLSASTAGSALAGTPAYALVTAGTAEWVGWQTTEGRPMFPRPVGRLACAVNPVDASTTVFAVSERWQPPPPMDGCPASPIGLHAGDRQVGGPSAFVLLPWGGMSWWADDPSLRIRVRIAPTPATDARITATARPLDGRGSIDLEVESSRIPSTRPPTSNHYLWLRDVRFPTDGCWLVSVSVDGAAVGAAILPVTRRPG